MKARRHKERRARRGLALVDVIVGTIMLAVGLAVVISSTSRSLSSQTRGEKQMMASWLVDEYLSMVLVEGPEEYPKKNNVEGTCEFDDRYRYFVDIEYFGPQQTYVVTCTVSWETPSGWRDVSAQTHIAPRLNDEETVRAPEEPIDRDARYHPEEQDEG